GHGHEHVRIAPQAVGFRERTSRHHADVGSPVALLATPDLNERLRGGSLSALLWENHRYRVILASRQIEHRRSYRSDEFRIRENLPAGRRDFRGESLLNALEARR